MMQKEPWLKHSHCPRADAKHEPNLRVCLLGWFWGNSKGWSLRGFLAKHTGHSKLSVVVKAALIGLPLLVVFQNRHAEKQP